MKINNLNKFPNDEYGSYTIEAFGEYELECLNVLNLDEIWYWYGSGDYCGTGQLLMRKGDLYDLHDCGHCSCYGPTTDSDYCTPPFNGLSLDELKKKCSGELLKEVQCLFDEASK
jgi:hypothetical protein